MHANLGVVNREVVDQVCWRVVHGVDLRYLAESLGVSLSDHDLSALLDELNAILELESNGSLVIRPHHILVALDLHSLDRLPHSSDVQHALETILNSRVVVKNLDVSVKVLDAKRMVLVLTLLPLVDVVDEVGALSDLVVLDGLRVLTDSLDVDADRRHLSSLLDVDSVLMDALDDNRLEVAVPIRSKHHLLLDLQGALQHRSSENQANTFAEVSRVDNELGVDVNCLRHHSLRVLLLIDDPLS